MAATIGRKTAAVGLLLLGGGGMALAAWSVSGILETLSAFAACTTPLDFYTHDFVLTGAGAIGLLPLLALSRNERFHKVLLGMIVLVFIGLPVAAFLVVDRALDDHGYAVASGSWSVIARDVAELEAVSCTPAGAAE